MPSTSDATCEGCASGVTRPGKLSLEPEGAHEASATAGAETSRMPPGAGTTQNGVQGSSLSGQKYSIQ